MLGGAELPAAQTLDPWLQIVAAKTMPEANFAEERQQFIEYGLAQFLRGPRKLPLAHDLLASADQRLLAARSTP